jgi:predicted nucleic acid-binding protein
VAQELLARGCAISVQGLNELANVARRKLGMDWQEVRDALAAIRTICRLIVLLDVELHGDALRIAERYGYAMSDALVLAAALRADCDVVWSEAMHDGMVIDGRLHIGNPFRPEQRPPAKIRHSSLRESG